VATKTLAEGANKPTGNVPLISREVFQALPVINRAVLILMARNGEIILEESAGAGTPAGNTGNHPVQEAIR
jgi:hypothetical protein